MHGMSELQISEPARVEWVCGVFREAFGVSMMSNLIPMEGVSYMTGFRPRSDMTHCCAGN